MFPSKALPTKVTTLFLFLIFSILLMVVMMLYNLHYNDGRQPMDIPIDTDRVETEVLPKSMSIDQITITDAPSESKLVLTSTVHSKAPNASSFPFLIFQIGFHKCGTRTTFHYFHSNRIPGVHHKNFNGKRSRTSLREMMVKNLNEGRLIMDGLSEEYMFFSDYGIKPKDSQTPWYELILKQYPDTKFLLQIRSINKWLRSRFNHYNPRNGFFIERVREQKMEKGISINGTVHPIQGLDEMDQNVLILRGWRQNWYQYICDMMQYLNDFNMMDNLIIYDIEQDDPSKLASYFSNFGLQFPHPNHLPHVGNTGSLKHQRMLRQMDKYSKIVDSFPEFGNLTDSFDTEEERIMDKCKQIWLASNG